MILVLLLLHGPGGGEIILNSKSITSMHAAIPGKPNRLVVEPARCVINTTDGKFVSVIESCDDVRKMIK